VVCVQQINEHDLEYAVTLPLPLSRITTLLGVQYMGPADWIRTKHEARNYLESGDVGAARALIQHAKVRRENWAEVQKKLPNGDCSTKAESVAFA
jgi:hypothetical protein